MKRKLNSHELESIGKAIFTREMLPPAEIDRIVSNPELFSLMKKRIRVVPTVSAKVPPGVSPSRRFVFAWTGVAMAFAVVFGLVALRYFEHRPERASEKAPVLMAVTDQVPDAVPGDVARLEDPPQPITGKLSASRATKIEKDEPRYEQAIVRTTVPRRRSEPAAPEKFYPVSYTGDPMETAVGGQVIRVEMKRSSLFALGVDLPLENDDAVVKADLLVGRDGVTRAVRLVD